MVNLLQSFLTWALNSATSIWNFMISSDLLVFCLAVPILDLILRQVKKYLGK